MTKKDQKLTLDRPVTYQIKVPGVFDGRWLNWDREVTVAAETDDNGRLCTILTDTLDQAALQALLRRLYSLGLPLISVNCSDPK